MKFKKIGFILICSVLIVALSACTASSSLENSGTTQDKEQSAQTVTDREGNTIIIPENVQKIISMASATTQTLVHLGLSDKIVAVDDYSALIDGLPEGLPTYDMMTPDTESIAALLPDLIFVTEISLANGNDPFATVKALGVQIIYIPSPESIAEIKEDIRFIAEVTKTQDKAQDIILEMEAEIADIISKIKGHESRKTVLFEIAAAPYIYSGGTGTYLNEMIETLGVLNILSDQNGWLSVSEEMVFDKNPDYIFTNVDYIENPIQEIKDRNGWNVISAVKNDAVYLVNTNSSSRPNEYITVAMREMAKAIYPDLWS